MSLTVRQLFPVSVKQNLTAIYMCSLYLSNVSELDVRYLPSQDVNLSDAAKVVNRSVSRLIHVAYNI